MGRLPSEIQDFYDYHWGYLYVSNLALFAFPQWFYILPVWKLVLRAEFAYSQYPTSCLISTEMDQTPLKRLPGFYTTT